MVNLYGLIQRLPKGESHVVIGSRLGISKMTMGKWRRRYLKQGIEGLEEEERAPAVPAPMMPRGWPK